MINVIRGLEYGEVTKKELANIFKEKNIEGSKMVYVNQDYNYAVTLLDFVNDNDDFVVHDFSEYEVSITQSREDEKYFYPIDELLSDAKRRVKNLEEIKEKADKK